MIHDTVAIVIENECRFLLIKKAKGLSDEGEWAFPGGHVDEGETIKNAVKREAAEELGNIEIVDKEPFFVFIHSVPKDKKGPHEHKCHTFRGMISGEIIPDTDVEDFDWFSKQEVLDSPKVQKWTKTIIEKHY